MIEPHAVKPSRDKLTCLRCGRRIAKGPRRPSGLFWRHVA